MGISVRNLKKGLPDSVVDELALEFKQVRKVYGMADRGQLTRDLMSL